MTGAAKKGPFVSDDAFADAVLAELPESEGGSGTFLFGISMENHFSYEGEKYPSLSVRVSSDLLSAKETRILENYAEGVRDADAALAKLVAKLESRGRPTLLVFFGDHLGILGENFETYRTTGYVPGSDESEWSAEDVAKIRTPPFLIWKNAALRKADPSNAFEGNPTVRAPFFGTRILEQAGIAPTNPYLRFAESAEDCFEPEAPRLVPKAGRADCPDIFRTWERLQYFSLFDSEEGAIPPFPPFR